MGRAPVNLCATGGATDPNDLDQAAPCAADREGGVHDRVYLRGEPVSSAHPLVFRMCSMAAPVRSRPALQWTSNGLGRAAKRRSTSSSPSAGMGGARWLSTGA